jgi:peptide/nickel transport system substrate-binding protein
MQFRPRLLVASLIACAATSAHADTLLRSRINGDILSTEPGEKRDENTDTVLMHIGEGLVAFREDGSVGPLLARRIDVSPDGRTYTFTLRSGVTFHNGAPLTSAEVVWSFNRYLADKSRWRCAPELKGNGVARLTSVEAVDRNTVRLTLDRPSPLFLKVLARVDCAGTPILHPASVGEGGAWRAPIGTGPFRYGSRRSNEFIELLKFANYASLPGARDGNTGGKRPLVDRIRFVIIPDSSAARAALSSGAIDVLDGVAPSELDDLKARRDIRLQSAPTNDIYALLFQTRDRTLGDPRLRRAIALSIDIRALTKAVTNGTGRPNSSAVPTGSQFHRGIHSRVQGRNVAAARKLAAEAGYRGQPIKLVANKRYPQMFDAAVLVQAMAMEAGINFQIETYDWATQLDRYTRGDYQAMTFSYSARLDPSFSIDAMIGSKAVEPRKVWDYPAAEALLEESMATTDPALRQAAFDKLQGRLLAYAPLVVFYNPSHTIATRANVSGVKAWPAVQQRLWAVKVGR